jgi:hypothetical protein
MSACHELCAEGKLNASHQRALESGRVRSNGESERRALVVLTAIVERRGYRQTCTTSCHSQHVRVLQTRSDKGIQYTQFILLVCFTV